MTRAQVRSTVRYEAVIIAMFGAVEGLVVGTAFGTPIAQALESEGLHTISAPVLRMVIVTLLAGVAGMTAALRPSPRAARLEILRAVRIE